MLVFQEVYEHPSQASRVRLNVYEYTPASPVAGLGPTEPGYLVTEDRAGTVKVVSTLGFFPTREPAFETVRARARELQAQRYRSAIPAA
ncbi:MAG TPA: hypothetical protein VMT87_01585 [Vicinamibacteria bacterium]|nr:hypothetical protein [Vicinamibacteria bacterium]